MKEHVTYMFCSSCEGYEIRIFKHQNLSIDMLFSVKHNGSLPKDQSIIWE